MTRRGPALALALAVIAAGGIAAAPRPAAAAAASCPAHRGTLAVDRTGRVWHAVHGLYACTTVGGVRPRTRRLGPWSPGGRVAFDGADVAWTVPLRRDGVRFDRAWAASAQDGSRWLAGARLVPATATAAPHEARVQRVLVADRSAAWVTLGGDVVLALALPGDSDPIAVGVLPGSLAPSHRLVLVGTWPQTPAATLASSARLVEGDNEGDGCEFVNPYTLTVRPEPGGAPVGATWTGDAFSEHC